jgi:hypothetical protein
VDEGNPNKPDFAAKTSTAGASRSSAPAAAASAAHPAAAAVAKPPILVKTKNRAIPHVVPDGAPLPADGEDVRCFKAKLPTCDLYREAAERNSGVASGDEEELQLWVPKERVAEWWDVSDPKQPKLKTDINAADSILFPIFVPSTGRAATSLLDLSRTIPERRYNQIVVVKAKEADKYRRGRPDFTFLVLPPSADDLGVGAGRYWILELAKTLLRDHPHPFIFVVDDNVDFWKGTSANVCARSLVFVHFFEPTARATQHRL